MTDLNSVTLVGRLCRDMEVRFNNNGYAVGSFSIAVNTSVKKDDKWTDEANFFDCVVFGKTAESLQNYLKKGQQVALQGSLKQDRWEKDGQKHSRIGITCNNIQLVGSKGQGGQHVPTENNSSENEFPEDVPF